jgi:hypothetical protein
VRLLETQLALETARLWAKLSFLVPQTEEQR